MKTFGNPNRRTFVSTAAAALAAPAILGTARAQSAENVTVETANGRLRGASASGAISFK